MMSDSIKKLRQKLFLSQEEFAKELCVSEIGRASCRERV